MAVATKATGRAFIWTLVVVATLVAIWVNADSIAWGLFDLSKFLVDRFVDMNRILSPAFADPWTTTKYVSFFLIVCVLAGAGGTIFGRLLGAILGDKKYSRRS